MLVHVCFIVHIVALHSTDDECVIDCSEPAQQLTALSNFNNNNRNNRNNNKDNKEHVHTILQSHCTPPVGLALARKSVNRTHTTDNPSMLGKRREGELVSVRW